MNTDSAENLSWTFFEQVSSLDNQLRNDEANVIRVNGCHLMTDNIKPSAYDVNAVRLNGEQQQQQQYADTNVCKTNGFLSSSTASTTTTIITPPTTTSTTTATTTKKLSGAILSQPSPDLIQQQQNSTFKFTSPTATFKRKKQQQLQLEQQQQQQQQYQLQSQQRQNNFTYNNFNYLNNSNSNFNHNIHNNNNNSNNNNSINNKNQLQVPFEHHSRPVTPNKSNSGNCSPNSLLLLARTTTATTTTTTTIATLSATSPLSRSATNTLKKSATLEKNKQKQQRKENHRRNDATAMISNNNSRILNADNNNASSTTGAGAAATTTLTTIPTTVTASGGNGNGKVQHSFKTRTLPAVVSTHQTYADDISGDGGGGNTKHATRLRRQQQQQHPKRRQQQTEEKMGASLKHSAESFVDGIEQHFGLIGWRKKCLYTLLVLLMILVITNLILTLWILKVMEFSSEGMGQLKIIPGGIQLNGQAIVMDTLKASTIRSRHGQPISIESSRNFSINTRDANGMLENHLFLGHDKLECLSSGFRINDTNGRNLFSVNRDEVTIGAHTLRVDGEGGAIFRESIQTPHVRAEPGRELRLESPTRQLEMTAARDINLQSRAGSVEMSALADVKLSALDGNLRLESPKILMPNLRIAEPPIPGTAQNRDYMHRVFQLCACSNGKLFLAAAHSICAGDDSTVCR